MYLPGILSISRNKAAAENVFTYWQTVTMFGRDAS
jgi:hypothetical protein